MVCDYGMSKLGLITIDKNNKNFLTESIQNEINNIINTCYDNTYSFKIPIRKRNYDL